MVYYDVLGNIAIIKSEGRTRKEVNLLAKQLLNRLSIKTVVEKVDRFKGRLRTLSVKHLAGEKNLIAEYNESGCRFKLDIEKCYFSPRLGNDRLEVAKKIKKKDNVLVMFAGIGPYPIVIQKKAFPKKLVSIELGRIPCKYAIENAQLNNVQKEINIIQGDVKKQIPKLVLKKEKFDVIVMARPNLKQSFILDALRVAKKGTKIYYHGFFKDSEVKQEIKNLIDEVENCKVCKKKIKILSYKQIGDLAPYKHRYGMWIKVI
jgi:tRNA (guanine37-N1)-methyltransferase